jgi:hypothetical protein
MYLYKDHEIIREHLILSGFMDNYYIWSKHDETRPRIESIIDEREEENMNVPDHVYSHHDDGGEDDVALGASSLMELDIDSVVLFFDMSPTKK